MDPIQNATATIDKPKSKPRRQFKSYRDIRTICDVPIAKRRELAIGRGGEKVIPRKFHLSTDEVAALKELHAAGDPLPNPHNKGFYFYLVEGLKKLGLNEQHSMGRLHQAVRNLMSHESTKDEDGETDWQRFENKPPKSEENELDWEGRFDQNIRVLQRLGGMTPYGLKLKEVGTRVLKTHGVVIDVLKDEGGKVTVRLNTNSAFPVNETKRASAAAKKAPKKAPKKAKKTKKAQPKKAETAAPQIEAKAEEATQEVTA